MNVSENHIHFYAFKTWLGALLDKLLAWQGGDQLVVLLRCSKSSDCFDSFSSSCIVGSGISHLPLDNSSKFDVQSSTIMPCSLNQLLATLAVQAGAKSFCLPLNVPLTCYPVNNQLLQRWPLQPTLLWRVSITVFQTSANSAVFPMIVKSIAGDWKNTLKWTYHAFKSYLFTCKSFN